MARKESQNIIRNLTLRLPYKVMTINDTSAYGKTSIGQISKYEVK